VLFHYVPGLPIFLGQQNIDHMLSEHPHDYTIYAAHITSIILNPDYVSLHPDNGSIQYIKEMNDRVLMAELVSYLQEHYS
jgi:hypothetical protein